MNRDRSESTSDPLVGLFAGSIDLATKSEDILYLKTEPGIILTTIYFKSDISDVSNEIIEEAIAQYEQ